MKPVTWYQTYDGVVHKNFTEATTHLSRQYDKLITQLSVEIHQLPSPRVTSVPTYIDDNLDLFLLLGKIRDDLKLITEEESEE